MKTKKYSIIEHGIIAKSNDFIYDQSNAENLFLSNDEFKSIYNYIISNQPTEGEIPFTIFAKSKRIQIKVKNYVGVIETPEGLILEILPKIWTDNSEAGMEHTREVFLKMLSSLKNTPFVNFNTAKLKSKRNFPILEVFIESFVEETEKLITQGIKFDYQKKEDNLKFLRGKIIISENIKRNSFDYSKFYCSFSELSEDIPQNRIVKATLLKLVKSTNNHRNFSRISKLLTSFESVKTPKSISHEFNKIPSSRNFSNYRTLILWAKIFLFDHGLTNFGGESTNIAVLFPIEKLFESYITKLFIKYSDGFQIKAQDKTYFLVESHRKKGKFQLKPDIYGENDAFVRFIVDTKWKKIDETKYTNNYDIKISDLYQLYAYGQKYTIGKNIPSLAIIYPKHEYFNSKLEPFFYDKTYQLNIFPFDFLKDEKKQITEIIELLESSQNY